MTETRAAGEARRRIQDELIRDSLTSLTMATRLGVRQQTFDEWLRGKVNYGLELKARKYLGMERLPVGRPPATAPEPEPLPERPTVNPVDRWVQHGSPAPVEANGHREETAHAPAPDPDDEFAFFTKGAQFASNWTEPGIRIAATAKNEINFSKHLKELVGGADRVRIGYRNRDGAILITAATEDGPEVFSLRRCRTLNSRAAGEWMLAHGSERGTRYLAVAGYGGAVSTP